MGHLTTWPGVERDGSSNYLARGGGGAWSQSPIYLTGGRVGAGHLSTWLGKGGYVIGKN